MGLFSSVKNAVSSAVDTVSSVASSVGEVADGATGGVMGMVGDTFESIGVDLGPLDDIVGEAMGALSGGGLGGMLNSALDSLGMPDWMGDVAGGVLDFCSGNMVGAVTNGLDALEDVAAACGGEELAGFLEAGAQVSGMFSGGAPDVGGKAGELIAGAQESIAMLDDTVGVVSDFAGGDILGAGQELLGAFGGDLGPLTSQFGGLADDTIAELERALPQARQMLEGADFASGSLSNMVDGLLGGVVSDVAAELGASHPDIEALQSKQQMLSELVGLAGDPAAAELLQGLLAETSSLRDQVNVTPHHAAGMRA
jgi:hypothetical protein